ncbi:C2H2-type zinc finger transcription factor [Phycomyces blakesleeanus NRRL 1555(-)]|uniref:C2H2-type zinc finger transcription factor n=1 Tax=Phycomyces blakesleeanus (strain ATCC 8743b / DSM 1359 / FGSC 10004 / NBRC 33097 / NRRL 1555) TaxID=763407 RepID=A0A162N824_PHYB8|nr:C2H2-type zinc finger transcription factor [Phycomyces blakesleeanus NRRL 1555(-)]OAD71978.1 C2H2-type zinc finger transcription factor [Phycomyces blakesleeanus NRRL 1555(-)]|eukprot:XP_018290018.1 C2H2-type zinc finger transcription factor [Phycomyces blakesleeanus NRRL 1555(-)]
MSSSNANQQRDRISTQQYQCDQCVLFFDNYQKLQNHKRIHRGDSATMTEIDQSILDDVDMYHDENDTSNEDESVSNSEYTMESMELDNTISYKCACNFEDSESEAHIYDSSRISTNTFTKAELMNHDDIMMEPGAKISHGETVDALLKSKSSVKGHEYDVCSSGCRLYGINDDQESCVNCSKPRYKTDPDQSQTPAASMKLMSVGDMLSQMLADPATRELLCYRANRESVAGQLTDIFDGDNYKQLVQQGLFSNPDDIAIGLYTDGPIHQKPTHLDSFLIPIINELRDLEAHGLVVKHNGVELCRSKVYLLLASGDIPAVADMAHIGSHTSLFGCRFCETKGKCPTNRRHGMYFDDISARLRPLEDFKVGSPSKNIYQPSIYTQLSTFSGSSFFALDELHLIARGIGKLVYDLITVTLTKETKFYYTHPDNTLNTTEYPFHIPRADLVTIGNCITSSRKYIPTSFQGSFDNVFAKIDGTRAVDWLDFLLYLVPTLVVPYLPNRAVKTALLSLVKGCALVLQWTLTSELLDEMESYFKHWHSFLYQQVQNNTLSRSVFRPVQHYLVHIPYIIKQQGPLRCYSTHSMERRFAIHNYTSTAISICDEINLIWPKPYGRESYMDLPNDPSGAQLWEPFHQFVNLNDDLVEGVGGPSVKEALLKYYRRTTGLTGHEFGDSVVVVAARLWMDSTVYSSCMYRRKKNETSRGNHYVMFTCPYRNNHNIIVHSWLVGTVQFYFQHVDFYGFPHFLAFAEVMKEHDAASHDSSVPIVKQQSQSTHTLGHQTQPTYAVISVNDICHQVGLVQYPPNGNQFYVIAPYYIFNNNMRITKGNLSIL